jgi:hypothetical protein
MDHGDKFAPHDGTKVILRMDDEMLFGVSADIAAWAVHLASMDAHQQTARFLGVDRDSMLARLRSEVEHQGSLQTANCRW